jgi:hypothetical protein
MAEKLRGPLEKFVDWRQCAALMQREAYEHNRGALPPVHDIFKRPSYEANNSSWCNVMQYSHLPSYLISIKNRDSSVGVTTDYGLYDQMIGVRIPVGAGNFSLHRVQTVSGAHRASYPVGTRGPFPGGK